MGWSKFCKFLLKKWSKSIDLQWKTNGNPLEIYCFLMVFFKNFDQPKNIFRNRIFQNPFTEATLIHSLTSLCNMKSRIDRESLQMSIQTARSFASICPILGRASPNSITWKTAGHNMQHSQEIVLDHDNNPTNDL